MCVVTGAGRPGVVREAALAATASELVKDGTLRDSLGNPLNGHAQAQARKLRGQRARDEGHQQSQRHRRQGPRRHPQDNGAATASSVQGPGYGTGAGHVGSGREHGGGAGDWNEKGGSVTERVERAAAAAEDEGGAGWEENTLEDEGGLEGEEQPGAGGEGERGDLVRTDGTLHHRCVVVTAQIHGVTCLPQFLKVNVGALRQKVVRESDHNSRYAVCSWLGP